MNNTQQNKSVVKYSFFKLAKIRASRRMRTMFHRGFSTNTGPKSTAR
jgi:hypothetical protein